MFSLNNRLICCKVLFCLVAAPGLPSQLQLLLDLLSRVNKRQERDRERKRETERERQTDRDRQRERDRHTERKRERAGFREQTSGKLSRNQKDFV